MLLVAEAMGCVCGKETLLIDGIAYDLGHQVGEGGFSTVHVAEPRRGKGRFAIKTIVSHSDRELQRARQEIDLHQRLGSHQNVLTLERYSVTSTQALAYRGSGRHQTMDTSTVHLVFPLYRRGTLQDDLNRRLADEGRPKLSEREVLSLFLDVARGLAQFHALQPPMAHRDVKPANVLVSESGRGVLMDFGSAGAARPEVSTSSQALSLQDEAAEHCSMPYRPPELFTVVPGNLIDERTDMWSLGCVLYALAFLKSPFEAVHERGDSVALAVAGACIWIPDYSQFSEDLHSLILDMMNLEINDRPFIQDVIARAQTLLQNVPQDGSQVV